MKDAETGKFTRYFKVRIGGNRSPRWTNENDLPEVIVKMFNDRESHRSSQQHDLAEEYDPLLYIP